MSGPCATWPLAEGCGTLPTDPAAWDAVQTQAADAATEILWRLSAGRFGLCREVLRPCMRRCLPGYSTVSGYRSASPYVAGGEWYNPPCLCGDADSCACGDAPEIRLPGPIHTDAEHPVDVLIDGASFTAFTVMGDSSLVRTDGARWPDCQRLAQPSSEVDTWQVAYYRGEPVPTGGRRAVAVLASEMHKACIGDRGCRLPARVSQIQREGVSYTMLDPQEFLDNGRTGLYEVDAWLRAVNPQRQHSPSGVWSPDMTAVKRVRP